MKKAKTRYIVIGAVILLLAAGLLLWLVFRNHSETAPVPDGTTAPALVEIRNMADWLAFAENVNAGVDYSETNVQLLTDLNFRWKDYPIIGSEKTPFNGVFFGNGHVLRNIRLESEEAHSGVFGYVMNAQIRGLHVKNCRITVGRESCAGGIVGCAIASQISGCSFEGTMKAGQTITGGIVGESSAVVEDCRVSGKITTETTTHTGGIAGVNNGSIYRCVNYADVYSKPKIQYITGGVTGGIAAKNPGEIRACINFGDIDGGGIALSTTGIITDCYNLGKAYGGIATSGSKFAVIDRCVNLGKVSGRYAAGILCFAGREDADYQNIIVTRCLYTGSRHAVTEKRDGEMTDRDNRSISSLVTISPDQLVQWLEADDLDSAYAYIINQEQTVQAGIRLTMVSCAMAALFAVLLVVLGWLLRIYMRGKREMQEGAYARAYKTFGRIRWFWNSRRLAHQCFRQHMDHCAQTGIYTIGNTGMKDISWIKIGAEADRIILLSEHVLLVEPVHCESGQILWQDSQLFEKLNTTVKQQYFDVVERRHLAGHISIPSVHVIESVLPDSLSRKCRSMTRLEEILSDGENVFWWAMDPERQPASKMPIVTPAGTISRLGKTISSSNIGVRPVIEVRL